MKLLDIIKELQINRPSSSWKSFNVGDFIQINNSLEPGKIRNGYIISKKLYKHKQKGIFLSLNRQIVHKIQNADWIEFGINYTGGDYNNFIIQYYFNPQNEEEIRWNDNFKSIKKLK